MNNLLKKGMSIKEYRALDLAIFTILMIVFEIVAVKAIDWFNLIYISLFITISLLSIMRWNIWGVVPIIAGSVTYSIMNGFDYKNYIISIIGSLFLLLLNLWFLIGKKKFKEPIYVILFVFSGFFILELGRTVVATILGYPFLSNLITLLLTDAINALMSLIIILITSKQNGLFEDQKEYILRIQKEENEGTIIESDEREE